MAASNGWPEKGKRPGSRKGKREVVDTHLTPYERIIKKLEDPVGKSEIIQGKRIGFYEIKEKLGEGAFAKVMTGVHALVKTKVAIKMIDKKILEDEKTAQLLQHEIACMEKLAHPHLIRLHEIIETTKHIYVIQEMAIAGDLAGKVCTMGHLSEDVSRRYFGQILSAVHYMHENNIIHRDIKPQNVLINAGDICKVADLGFARTVPTMNTFLSTFCGSPPFAAPELFKDDHYIGPFVDVWALGVVLYFMNHGNLPFCSENYGMMRASILTATYTVLERFSSSLTALIHQIFKLVPTHRPTIQEMMRSEWMEGAIYIGPLKSNRMRAPLEHEEKDAAEKVAVETMNTLGIPYELIAQSPVDSLRDRINGTYRITYYTQEKRILREQQVAEERREANRQERERQRKKQESKICALL